MKNTILNIDQELQSYRSSLSALLDEISHLSTKTRNPELIKHVNTVRYNVSKPFMFVVMGEVKAGKSSFINSLLGAEACATDVKPCTDKIQVIYYSEEQFLNEINQHLVEIGRPIEILREISIVDTPGTNSVIENHQIITDEFIPSCDLAFFVLFARNPYFESTWKFLDYVSSKWHKKIVLVLQQADLLKSEELLDQNIHEVKKLAENKGIQDPAIFATSAELESNGDTANSGFKAVRDYIKNLVTTKEVYRLKLKNLTDTTREIINDLDDDVSALKNCLEVDREAVKRIKTRFERGRKRSADEVELTGSRVSERFSTIAERIKEEFREELSFLAVVRRTFTFSLKSRLESFSERCRESLESEIQEIAQERSAHILEGIRQFGEDLKQDLDVIANHQIEHGRFYVKVLEHRNRLLEAIRRKVDHFLDSESWVQSLNAGVEGAAIGTGGAITIITAVVVQIIEIVVANVALLASETVLAGIGVVFFYAGFAWRRRTIIRKFEQALDIERSKVKDAVTQHLNEKLNIVYDDLERECSQFYADVEQEEKEIIPVLDAYSNIQTNFDELASRDLKF